MITNGTDCYLRIKKSYLFKPIVEYSKPRMANSGYSVNKAAEFKLKKIFCFRSGNIK